MSETILLNNSEIYPTDEVLEKALGKDIFRVYEEMIKIITSIEFELKPERNFYKDGKSRLCKVTSKKKTVFWLSVWENHITTGFYFNTKTRSWIFSLKINPEIIQQFEEAKPIGKLFPLVLEIDNKIQFDDLKELIRYKKNVT